MRSTQRSTSVLIITVLILWVPASFGQDLPGEWSKWLDAQEAAASQSKELSFKFYRKLEGTQYKSPGIRQGVYWKIGKDFRFECRSFTEGESNSDITQETTFRSGICYFIQGGSYPGNAVMMRVSEQTPGRDAELMDGTSWNRWSVLDGKFFLLQDRSVYQVVREQDTFEATQSTLAGSDVVFPTLRTSGRHGILTLTLDPTKGHALRQIKVELSGGHTFGETELSKMPRKDGKPAPVSASWEFNVKRYAAPHDTWIPVEGLLVSELRYDNGWIGRNSMHTTREPVEPDEKLINWLPSIPKGAIVPVAGNQTGITYQWNGTDIEPMTGSQFAKLDGVVTDSGLSSQKAQPLRGINVPSIIAALLGIAALWGTRRLARNSSQRQ